MNTNTKTWTQNRCVICGRYLAKYGHRYCPRCNNAHDYHPYKENYKKYCDILKKGR